MTGATTGVGPGFFAAWARSFLTTLLVLPFVLASLGFLEKLVVRVLGDIPDFARKLAVALLAACVIETVIALAVTAVGRPLDNTFAANWWLAFSRSLPAGLAISLLMSFYIKPRMARMLNPTQVR